MSKISSFLLMWSITHEGGLRWCRIQCSQYIISILFDQNGAYKPNVQIYTGVIQKVMNVLKRRILLETPPKEQVKSQDCNNSPQNNVC